MYWAVRVGNGWLGESGIQPGARGDRGRFKRRDALMFAADFPDSKVYRVTPRPKGGLKVGDEVTVRAKVFDLTSRPPVTYAPSGPAGCVDLVTENHVIIRVDRKDVVPSGDPRQRDVWEGRVDGQELFVRQLAPSGGQLRMDGHSFTSWLTCWASGTRVRVTLEVLP